MANVTPSFDRGRVASQHWQPVVNTDYSATPFILHCMAAGTVTIVPVGNVDADALQYTVAAGERLPILIKKITAVGTLTVADLRAWQ